MDNTKKWYNHFFNPLKNKFNMYYLYGMSGPDGMSETYGMSEPYGMSGPDGMSEPYDMSGPYGMSGPDGMSGPYGMSGQDGMSGPDGMPYFDTSSKYELYATYKKNIIRNAIKYNKPIEDKLNVIIVISNPCNYKRRYILAKEFIKRITIDEPDVELYIVELAYGDQNYYLTEKNNKKHLQLRSKCPMWHKENMINLAVKYLLPKNYKAFAWRYRIRKWNMGYRYIKNTKWN